MTADDSDSPIPVNIEVNCEYTDEDRKIQEFLLSTQSDIDEFCWLYFIGRVYDNSRSISQKYPDSYDPELEYIYGIQSDAGSFKNTGDLDEFMQKYFSADLYKTQKAILIDGWYSDGYYVPPFFINANGRLYRREAVRNREVEMDYNTAKVIAHEGDTVIYACLGRDWIVVPEYQALYGALRYEDGDLKYEVLPWYIYEYDGSTYGDTKEIWGI
ncbi:MAG: hypothetical protein J6O50_07520 [Ruminiclostridium sp.]|nr:hypothetical protein [Ruminiclostridium sp.]